ncbi:DUF7344 domain-containing protein [Halorarum salinum]|uniref:Helix-turn-helix transcriptional regulator n=1 Tax=Halorarum salinum TaxID=2743089 RepID=A0A7D5L9K6_9EURY|nr:helix-turn-helix domain-containing protein [Halobaculum salinum]QLG61526.1 helix-turn-helix transcriptional regulator [Halobaculum salinum]
MTKNSGEATDVQQSDSSVERTRSPDELFDALADRRRRDVLDLLRTHGGPMSLADLADEIAVREDETPITEVTPGDATRVYMSLYHTHVPKLADAGFLEYDRARDAVAPTDGASELDPILDAVEDAERELTRSG